MLQTSPSRHDQEARALRERLELAVLGDDDRVCAEAARALVSFVTDHPEYLLCTLIPESVPVAAEEAKRIESKFESRCKACRALIVPGAECFYTPGEKGVSCLKCGAKP